MYGTMGGLGVRNCQQILNGTMVWVCVSTACVWGSLCLCWITQHSFGEKGNERERNGSALGSLVALQPELGIPGKEVVGSHCYSGGPSIFSGFYSSVVSLFCYCLSLSLFFSLCPPYFHAFFPVVQRPKQDGIMSWPVNIDMSPQSQFCSPPPTPTQIMCFIFESALHKKVTRIEQER